jgi:hypothetical protein
MNREGQLYPLQQSWKVRKSNFVTLIKDVEHKKEPMNILTNMDNGHNVQHQKSSLVLLYTICFYDMWHLTNAQFTHKGSVANSVPIPIKWVNIETGWKSNLHQQTIFPKKPTQPAQRCKLQISLQWHMGAELWPSPSIMSANNCFPTRYNYTYYFNLQWSHLHCTLV